MCGILIRIVGSMHTMTLQVEGSSSARPYLEWVTVRLEHRNTEWKYCTRYKK